MDFSQIFLFALLIIGGCAIVYFLFFTNAASKISVSKKCSACNLKINPQQTYQSVKMASGVTYEVLCKKCHDSMNAKYQAMQNVATVSDAQLPDSKREFKPLTEDHSDLYWAMHKNARRIANDIELIEHKHSNTPNYENHWEKILKLYEAFVKQSEDAAKLQCEENRGELLCYTTATDTVFHIFAKRKMFAEAESYITRLRTLKYRNPELELKKALLNVEEDDNCDVEISKNDWLKQIPERIQKTVEAKHSILLKRLINECIFRQEADTAQSALDALLSLKESGEVIFSSDCEILLQKAEIALIRKNYELAIAHLQKAHSIVANKTEIKKIEAMMRKILRAKSVPKSEINNLSIELLNPQEGHP